MAKSALPLRSQMTTYDERFHPELADCLNDTRIPICPIVAAPSEQPDAFVLLFHDEPVPIVLQLMDPHGTIIARRLFFLAYTELLA